MIGFSMCVEIDGADVIRIEGLGVPFVVLSDNPPTLPLERSLLGA
jgi:hypothetical protein